MKLEKQLDTDMTNARQVFSVGETQLICLARAVLRASSILILDEATANVDLETDEFIQRFVKQEYKDGTVLTIAHRLNTIADYDKIIVMDKGRAVQYGDPYDLLADDFAAYTKLSRQEKKRYQFKSLFAEMVKNTGEANANLILKLAQEKKLGTQTQNIHHSIN